jgi:hypothetical protein
MTRVMSRLNLTLDPDTWAALTQHASTRGAARAAVARELIEEGLARRAAVERRRNLAADYAAEDDEPVLLLAELELAQLDLLDDDEA